MIRCGKEVIMELGRYNLSCFAISWSGLAWYSEARNGGVR